MIDLSAFVRTIDDAWEIDALPHLADYIAIPAQSPTFDPEWRAHGHLHEAAHHLIDWVKRHLHRIPGARAELMEIEGRTPTIVVEVPGAGNQPVLLYGHYDKQPEMTGWDDGLGPWQPVLKDGKLYGRGGADDGYAVYAAIIALSTLAQANIIFPRCIILIEGSEKSGSTDLPAYIELLADRINSPPLVICLDSGCGNYDQLWATTSLRGLTTGTLNVRVLTEGVHSGAGSGIVPSSFRIARLLLERLEDATSGNIVPRAFHADIPIDRIKEANVAGATLGSGVMSALPFAGDTQAVKSNPAALILSRSWHAGLEITGAEGIPSAAVAGNVLRPTTNFKLSLRLPPTVCAATATATLKQIIEQDPPYQATVHFEPGAYGDGWNAPAFAPWLVMAMESASLSVFGRSYAASGEGGSIPFMAMLGARYPEAQFLITGVLGPASNAHGPNEFLHIAMTKKVTACVALILAAAADNLETHHE